MENKEQEIKKIPIRGYIYILIEKFTIPTAGKEVSCILSLGSNANCQTKSYSSGSQVNEVFLIEVPEDPSRLVAEFKQEDTVLGECRYDISPFFSHPGASHTLASDIMKGEQNKGTANMKITYFSAEHGKFKIRVFYLSMVQPIVEHYQKAKLKIKIGIYAQSSSVWDMKTDFDETMEILILNKNGNLDFEIVNQEGILAKYTIYDVEKSGLMIDKTKAYQVSLFNKDKAVGTIKYQVDWIKHKQTTS